MLSPELDVVVLTRNHAHYIAQALDSILTQQVPFAVRILVGVDSSTDQTPALVAAYCRRYPQRIEMLLHDPPVGAGANLAACLRRCQGRYLAVLEGDDYWTHPQKLARQVAWLDQHPDCSLSFHPVRIVRGADAAATPAEYLPTLPGRAAPPTRPRSFTFGHLLRRTIPHTSAVVLRRTARPLPDWLFTVYPLDFAFFALFAEVGQATMLPEAMSCYRLHPGGSWSAAPLAWRQQQFLAMFRQLVAHYAPTKHARRLRQQLSQHYLSAADEQAAYGTPAQATEFLRESLRLWRNYGPGQAKSLLSVSLRWLRSRWRG